jgi:hypothetical protein
MIYTAMQDWQQRRERGRQLARELHAAHERYHTASGALREIIMSVSLGILTPDSSFRITAAGNAREAAYAKYLDALQRWDNFSLYGILPEDDNEGHER